MDVPLLVAGATALVVLGVGGASTTIGPWYRNLRKPRWNPPDWVFGPAWTLILGLAAWAGALAWNASADGDSARLVVSLFAINILFHMAWSPLFFNLRRPDWALYEIPLLWLSILALIIGLRPLAPLTTWLLLPYLLWASFAAFLNWTIVRLNRPFGARNPDHP